MNRIGLSALPVDHADAFAADGNHIALYRSSPRLLGRIRQIVLSSHYLQSTRVLGNSGSVVEDPLSPHFFALCLSCSAFLPSPDPYRRMAMTKSYLQRPGQFFTIRIIQPSKVWHMRAFADHKFDSESLFGFRDFGLWGYDMSLLELRHTSRIVVCRASQPLSYPDAYALKLRLMIESGRQTRKRMRTEGKARSK
jgi:hypothetical protein